MVPRVIEYKGSVLAAGTRCGQLVAASLAVLYVSSTAMSTNPVIALMLVVGEDSRRRRLAQPSGRGESTWARTDDDHVKEGDLLHPAAELQYVQSPSVLE